MKTYDYQPQDIKNLPVLPGVYFYYDRSATVLYVGKAKILKARVAQYFQGKTNRRHLENLVCQIETIRIIITSSEADALLLEDKMIKKHKPKYNVLLKDDKTYPYICFTDHEYPRLMVIRNRKYRKYRYFGPYTNGRYIRHIIDMLQQLFMLRTCANSFFSNRSRPCLLYQIKRCLGPCVEKAGQEKYAHALSQATQLLSGNAQDVVDDFVKKMHIASQSQQYEKAAKYRDMIHTIQVFINETAPAVTEQCLDIICAAPLDTGYLIQLTIYKDSMIESQRDYHFPEFTGLPSDLIEQFLFQLYSPDCHLRGRIAAKTILLDVSLIEVSTISATVLSSLGIQKRVKLAPTTKNERTFWHSARTNVDYAIARYISQQSQYSTQFSLLAQSFLDADWAYIDCVDISHLQGQHTTASCVRFSVAGAEKSSFRAYSLDTGNDDYASMRAFIHRRYQGARQLAPANLLLIDGGLGQLSAIQKAFVDIKHPNPPHLLAICKAPGRRSGEEKYYTTTATDGAKSLDFPETVTRLLENIRDHAHRFAITRQRKKQLKASLESCLHAVPGLGNYRITQLLHYFGSFEVLTQASIEQIQQVPGISKNLAERIYNLLHKS